MIYRILVRACWFLETRRLRRGDGWFGAEDGGRVKDAKEKRDG